MTILEIIAHLFLFPIPSIILIRFLIWNKTYETGCRYKSPINYLAWIVGSILFTMVGPIILIVTAMFLMVHLLDTFDTKFKQ